MYVRLSEAEKREIWEQLRAGLSSRMIAGKLRRSSATVRDYVAITGGCGQLVGRADRDASWHRSGRRSPAGWLAANRCG